MADDQSVEKALAAVQRAIQTWLDASNDAEGEPRSLLTGAVVAFEETTVGNDDTHYRVSYAAVTPGSGIAVTAGLLSVARDHLRADILGSDDD